MISVIYAEYKNVLISVTVKLWASDWGLETIVGIRPRD